MLSSHSDWIEMPILQKNIIKKNIVNGRNEYQVQNQKNVFLHHIPDAFTVELEKRKLLQMDRISGLLLAMKIHWIPYRADNICEYLSQYISPCIHGGTHHHKYYFVDSIMILIPAIKNILLHLILIFIHYLFRIHMTR